METSSAIASHLRKLCFALSADPDGAYEMAVTYLSAFGEKSRSVQDEKQICQKIQSRLVGQSARDADKFNEYYSKLKNSFILKQRVSVLALLLALSESPEQSESTQQLFPIPFLAKSATGATSSTSKSTIGSASWGSNAVKPQGSIQSLPSNSSNMAVALQSPDSNNERACVRDAVLAATGVRARGAGGASRPAQALHARISYLDSNNERACVRDAVLAATGVRARGAGGASRPAQALHARISYLDSNNERACLRDAVLAATGVRARGAGGASRPAQALHARISYLDSNNERACVRDAVLAATGVRARGAGGASRPAQALHARIAHLGFLHDRLKEFIDPSSGLMPQGLMGEGLVSSIRDELTEYYRSLALLQSQACEGDGGGGTLRRVCVWAQEPLHRLTWLANIAHTAHHKKGGELASCVHRFVRHGDERVATLARRLLTALTYPLLLMLTRWLLHGEIDDPFNEFFIESRSGVPIDRMWHDKYRVREWMVPSFMSREQAAQILATGKSVVFMREACGDEPGTSDHAHHLHALLKAHTGGDSEEIGGTAWWEAEGLRAGVEAAHAAASRRLLAALSTHHHLLDHLAAHRRYLLLAQGDFHHHLMTLLQEELNKPASSLYVHNLSCTLEAAVRATNAQFEPPHVLARLHVNLYPNCDGREDCGWDVFALQYRVDGPLGTLFPATAAARYRALFTQLWRVKRIEYSLHEAWREHTILHKRLKYMPEVWSLMRRVSCLRAEALRLCGALQEAGGVGAEPAWRELLAAAASQQHLDTLLQLHHRALDRHSIHAMIHHTTQEIQSYLGNVLNETLALRSFEASLHGGIHAELQRRAAIEQMKEDRVARGEYAFTAADEAQDKDKRKIFQQFLATRKADLNVWARSYRGHVTTLILKLALHAEVSLQTLAFRLDYSDFYKRGNAKLHAPLTYQHKRLSEIGLNLAKSKMIDRTKKK